MNLPAQPHQSFVRRAAEGIELRLKVFPGASRSMIVGVLGDRLKVKVAAPPEDSKANQAVIALISVAPGVLPPATLVRPCTSEWLDCDVELIAGHSHAEKLVRIRGLAKLDEGHLSALK